MRWNQSPKSCNKSINKGVKTLNFFKNSPIGTLKVCLPLEGKVAAKLADEVDSF